MEWCNFVLRRKFLDANIVELKCSLEMKKARESLLSSKIRMAKNIDVYPSCKGECDEIQKRARGKNGLDGWKVLSDFANPMLFMKNIFAFMNNVQDGNFSDEAFKQYKEVLLTAFQYVLREPTNKERRDFEMDDMLRF